MQKKFLYTFFLFCLGWVVFSACRKEPNYKIQPHIEFKDIQVVRLDPRSGSNFKRDSVLITITFRDGDGDLGLEPTDTLDPFGPDDDHFSNYYITILEKQQNGEFKPLELPFSFNSRFRTLSPTPGNDLDIEGELTFGSIVLPVDQFVGSTFKFEIFIEDRALHKSNTIVTNEITIQE